MQGTVDEILDLVTLSGSHRVCEASCHCMFLVISSVQSLWRSLMGHRLQGGTLQRLSDFGWAWGSMLLNLQRLSEFLVNRDGAEKGSTPLRKSDTNSPIQSGNEAVIFLNRYGGTEGERR